MTLQQKLEAKQMKVEEEEDRKIEKKEISSRSRAFLKKLFVKKRSQSKDSFFDSQEDQDNVSVSFFLIFTV